LVIAYVSVIVIKFMNWTVFHLLECGKCICAICFG